MILTQEQLVAVEQNTAYKDQLRMAVLAQAAFWKGNTGVGLATPPLAEEWFRKRQLAENIYSRPDALVDRPYWAGKSLITLKNMDIGGITDVSTADEIVDQISTVQWEQLSIATFTDEAKKTILFNTI